MFAEQPGLAERGVVQQPSLLALQPLRQLPGHLCLLPAALRDAVGAPEHHHRAHQEREECEREPGARGIAPDQADGALDDRVVVGVYEPTRQEPLELVGEGAGVGVAGPGVAGHRLLDHGHEVAWRAGGQDHQGDRRSGGDGCDHVRSAIVRG